MKQVVFDRAGDVHVDEVPAPAVSPGRVLVRVAHSVISTGTETAQYARGGVASQVADDPRLVRKVLDRVGAAGVRGAIDQVKERLGARSGRGYAGAGVVVEVGEGVSDLRVGDRVAYGGEPHGEYVCVPRNLVAPVPDDVSLEHAAVTTIGSIALHGLRLGECELGGSVVVIGLGLVGQLTVALARAMGLRVAGGDLLASRVELARRMGLDLALDVGSSESARRVLADWTEGIGADAAIVCAGTASSAPTRLALELCRDRGTVVVVGASGLELERPPLFRKELTFRVSRSYGPGRYDPDYEERGRDYPPGYVRWTENRNFGAFLTLLERGLVDPAPLLSLRFPVERAAEAYAALKEGSDAPLTAVLDYAPEAAGAVADVAPPVRRVALRAAGATRDRVRVALVGAGSFAKSQIVPALRRAQAEVVAVAAATGLSASNAGRLVGAEYCTTSYADVLADASVDAVVIATRHDLHHPIALAAAAAGKPFHVEKPLALTSEQCREIVEAVSVAGIPATVGFNRRSAPFVRELVSWLADRSGPVQILIRVNANPVPADHWTLDPREGGGRLVGEGCHFIDLASHLAGSRGRVVAAHAVDAGSEAERESNTSLTLRFEDGSLAVVSYLSTGHRGLPKERIEVSWDGRSVVIDDFRRIEAHGVGRSRSLRVQDKGIRDHFANFLSAVGGREDLVAPVSVGLDVSERIDEAKRLLAGDA